MHAARHRALRFSPLVVAVIATIVLVSLLSLVLVSSLWDGPGHTTFDLPALLVLLVLTSSITRWIREEDAFFHHEPTASVSSPRAPPAFFF